MSAPVSAPQRSAAPADEPARTSAPDREVQEDRGSSAPPGPAAAALVAAGLACGAAGWLVSTLFDPMPQAMAAAVAGIAASLTVVAAARRSGQPGVAGVGGVAGALAGALVGALLGAGVPGPSDLAAVLSSPGLAEAPVRFTGAWGGLLGGLLGAVAAAAVTLRPAVPAAAIGLPLVLTAALGLLVPDGREVAGGIGALLALVAALAVVGGPAAERSWRFELRRLARGALLLAGIGGALAALAQLGLLLPQPRDGREVPPRTPPPPKPQPDRVMVSADRDPGTPLRLGALDAYEDGRMLLAPLRTADLRDMGAGGRLPGGPATTRERGGGRPLRLVVGKLPGAALPTPPGVAAVTAGAGELKLDPRAGVLRHRTGGVPEGFEFSAVSAPAPTPTELAAAPEPPESVRSLFTRAPEPPAAVRRLLAGAPRRPLDRSAALRRRMLNSVVAEGAGKPEPVTPGRVAQMLRDGTRATPYEIAVGEMLLARWSGVPARLGFGFSGGRREGGRWAYRPRDAAVYLEVNVGGRGWVPLASTPPRARAASGAGQARSTPSTVASDELGVVVYVPVELEDLGATLRMARFLLVLLVTSLLLASLLIAVVPMGAKALRRRRRRRWAALRGPAARIWAEYAELRDFSLDAAAGTPGLTPLELCEVYASDAEHEELAWLVTRSMWGDLRRDPDPRDAADAAALARSVRRRAASRQPAGQRLLTSVSLTSLRAPYDPALPNAWPAPRPPRRPMRRVATALRRNAPRPATAALAAVAALLGLAGCSPGGGWEEATHPAAFPADPPEKVGALKLRREPDAEKAYERAGARALVTDGRLWTLRDGKEVAATLQVSRLKPDVGAQDPDVQRRVEQAIEGGRFTTRRIGGARVREQRMPDQRIYLWFPPRLNAMMVIVVRAADPAGPDIARRLILNANAKTRRSRG